MNEQNNIKRTNKWLIVLIILIALIIILFPLIIAIIGLILVPKLMTRVEEKVGNHTANGLSVYIPYDWNLQGDYHVSPSGNCKIIGGTTLFEQDRTERINISDELEHKNITLNGIKMSYGYKDDGIEKIYSYYFEDYSNKYFIIFRNKVDSDQECDSYLEKLEQSINLDTEEEDI